MCATFFRDHNQTQILQVLYIDDDIIDHLHLKGCGDAFTGTEKIGSGHPRDKIQQSILPMRKHYF